MRRKAAVGGLVVVGASLAGLRAVESARRSDWDGPITLVGAEHWLPYDRLPLSKTTLAAGGPGDFRPFRTRSQLTTDLEVNLALGERAIGLDPQAQCVETTGRIHRYDRLVIATGSNPVMLPGVSPSERILSLRTWDDAIALARRFQTSRRLVVVGGGFIGSEIASAARTRGISVTIVEAAAAPLIPALGEEVAHRLAALHARNDVELLTCAKVGNIRERGNDVTVDLEDGRVLTADTVVIGVGSRPAVDWLAGSGLEIDNGVLCDTHLRAYDNVWAAGDMARWPNALLGGTVARLEHWTSAAEQGRCAGHNAVSEVQIEFGTVPIFWSDWYSDRIQFLGATGPEVTIVGDDEQFLAFYAREGRLTGAVGLNSATVLRLRQQIIDGAEVAGLSSIEEFSL